MYGVTAWLLLQVGSVTFEPLGLPAWSQKALIIAVLLGFPVVLMLAWIFEAPAEGVVDPERVASSRLRRALKFDVAIIAVLLVALGVTWFSRREPATPTTSVSDGSVAVLPFVPIGTDPSLKPLGEALAEQVTNDLAGRSELRVASRTPAFDQGGKEAVAIARALRVAYVLQGSVRPADARVRVTAQLVRGADGIHLWSETYDVTADQNSQRDETALTIAYKVPQYIELEQDLERDRMRTQSQAAYDYYAAARKQQMGPGDPKGWRHVLDNVDRALALDPDFVPALRSRAGIYVSKVGFEACGPRCPDEARRSIEHALALQPDDAEALRQLATLQLTFDLDPAAAEATLDRIRRVDPRYRWLNSSYASLEMFRGNVRDAREYAERQLEVTPYDAVAQYVLAMILRAQGDSLAAEHAYDMTMRLAPRSNVSRGGDRANQPSVRAR